MLLSNELYITGLKIRWDSIAEDSYLRNIEAIREINEIRFHSPVTFFVGENGSGKSTLLEAIAIAYGFNPEGGTKNYRFSTYDSHSELYGAIRLVRGAVRTGWGYFLRAESFYIRETQVFAASPARYFIILYYKSNHLSIQPVCRIKEYILT